MRAPILRPLCALVLVSACDEPPPPAPPPAVEPGPEQQAPAAAQWKTPADPKIEWDDRKFKLVGTDLKGLPWVGDGKVEIKVYGVPAGTEVSFGPTSAKVGDDRMATVEAPVGPELAELPVTEALDYDLKADLKTPLQMKFPDGGSVSVKLEGIAIHGVKDAMEAVAKGQPMEMGEDPEGHATYFEAYFGSMPENLVVGDAPTFGHIDRVAVKTELAERPANKKCKAVSGNQGELFMQDWEVTVYERATAKEIGKKTFVAKKKCPPTWLDDKATSNPETEPIEKWLQSL